MFTQMALPSRSALPSASETPRSRSCSDQPGAQEVLAWIAVRYATTVDQIAVGTHTLSLRAVRDTNALLDAIDPATFTEDERLPYWADLWPSSIELARSCLSDFRLANKRVLELGCGLGLAGIAAALSGALVTMTDYEPDALMFARWNALANLDPETFHSRVTLRQLDWRKGAGTELFDVVIGSDIVYEQRNLDPLLTMLTNVLAPVGYGVFTDPGRRTGREFVSEATRRGFIVETAETHVPWRGRQQMIVRYVLRRPGGGA